jgi:hypothetical protein
MKRLVCATVYKFKLRNQFIKLIERVILLATRAKWACPWR